MKIKKFNFTKMVASGNDFVVTDEIRARSSELRDLAKRICQRKYGIGADGLLVLEKSREADVKMRIFNADGSEAEMCGNGARCIALWVSLKSKVNIETKAGIIKSELKDNNIKIKLTEPRGIKLNLPIKLGSRTLHVNFINTGVPHVVIFAEGLDKINIANLGRQIRFHKKFSPKGTNVDFVEILGKDSIKVRTYERGVEDETLACGTGSVAAALITSIRVSEYRSIRVKTKSGEILNVYFNRLEDKFSNVWLEGKAKIVYRGEYYV